jgi:DNA helicase HerA-like ATPase
MSASNAGRIGVWGASGSGKSALVKGLLRVRKRVIVFDPLDEYSKEGFQRVTTGEAARLAMIRDWKGFRIAMVPQAGYEARFLNQISKLLLAAQEPYRKGAFKAQATFAVEEMNLSFPVHGGSSRAPSFADICSRGRHYGIEVFGLSQRIAEVDTRFRGNCTETYVLRQQGARDVDAASVVTGATKQRVSGIKNLQYLHEKNGEIREGAVKF